MGAAQTIYQHFLRDVVIAHVFSDAERGRDGEQLEAAQRSEIAQGRRVEMRPPFLVRRSGKGGWSADPDRAAIYARFTNVSLLDHLCSVVRGAVQLAEIDLRARRNAPDETDLCRRLATIATIAFLHDADKMLGQTRRDSLDPAQIDGLMARYGLDRFLEQHGQVLSADEMLALIERVETSRSGRLQGVPGHAIHDCAYVRLADRLDSRFLQVRAVDPARPDEKIGLEGVLDELVRYDDLDTDAARNWRVVRVRDPHTPFLLDALQVCLSEACRSRYGHPPLIETHHDGTLLVLIPQDGSDDVIETALAEVTGDLGRTIRIHINNRGVIDLLDARASLVGLRRSVESMRASERERLLFVNRAVLLAHGAEIEAFLGAVGFPPMPPDLVRVSSQMVPLWQGIEHNDAMRATHIDAALLNAVLSCKDSPALGIPDAEQREAELRCLLDEEGRLPAARWLTDAPSLTRHTLLAALAAATARDPAFEDRLLGPGGLVALWLEGRDGRRGLADKIAPSQTRLAHAVAAHYRALLAGRLVTALDEDAPGRCHFTNAPVPRSACIDGSTGLYGVKISAFSGREGRPESHRSAQAETLVAPIAEAEHRLRTIAFERPGRSASRRELPVLVSSPTASGLFGALAYARGNDPTEYAFADVLRAHTGKGLTYRDQDGTTRRARIARYEEMPTRWVKSGTAPGVVGFVAMAFAAAQRLGRPIHVFRGLPQQRPEFVFFDSLQQMIEMLLGGTGARLEQLPRAIRRLRGIEVVTDVSGFGAELAMRLCDPETRFGAACDALMRAEKRLAVNKNNADQQLRDIRTFSYMLLGDPDTMPSSTDRAIVAFGEAMALVQRVPRGSDGANIAELGLRTALDVVEVLERMGQTDDASLIAGVAGEIGEVLARRNLVARAEIRGPCSLDEAKETAARQFVMKVWHGAFGATVPSARHRRIALATYRFSFERAARARWKEIGQRDPQDDSES